jgi:hypothetical protein
MSAGGSSGISSGRSSGTSSGAVSGGCLGPEKKIIPFSFTKHWSTTKLSPVLLCLKDLSHPALCWNENFIRLRHQENA